MMPSLAVLGVGGVAIALLHGSAVVLVTRGKKGRSGLESVERGRWSAGVSGERSQRRCTWALGQPQPFRAFRRQKPRPRSARADAARMCQMRDLRSVESQAVMIRGGFDIYVHMELG